MLSISLMKKIDRCVFVSTIRKLLCGMNFEDSVVLIPTIRGVYENFYQKCLMIKR